MSESETSPPNLIPADQSDPVRAAAAYKTDTIVALATPPGISGIAVIRLSGPEAVKMTTLLCDAALSDQPRHAFFAQFTDPTDQSPLDAAVVTYFKGPASFTGEDVVEISTHGGYVSQRRVISALLRQGARQADRGEFSLRAYLNGKMDLTEAEALHQQIQSMTPRAQLVANENAGGRLSRQISEIRQRLVRISTIIEHELDFSEAEIAGTTTGEVIKELDSAISGLRRIGATGPFGKLLREGINVVLAGAPNAGKSSLFNALVGREQAIVTDHPGTTRDSLEAWINIDGFPICLIDTAGLNEAAEDVEQLGVERSKSAIDRADIVLFLDPIDPFKMGKTATSRDTPVIYLRSRADEAATDVPAHAIDSSVVSPGGIDALHAALIDSLRRFIPADSAIATSDRQARGVEDALKQLSLARTGLKEGQTYDLIAADIRIAIDALSEIIGDTPQEEILAEIFSQFCVGK